MTVGFKAVSVGVMLVLAATVSAWAAKPKHALIAIELETRENTVDGCGECACRTKGLLERGKAQRWWVAFGLAAPHADNGWEAVWSSSHCGSGSFKKIETDFRRTVGTPYVVLELRTIPTLDSDDRIELQAPLVFHELTGFDEKGVPVYQQTKQNRTLSLADAGELVLPLLIPDEREQEAFGVHEVLVQIKATVLGKQPPAAYGLVSVTADVPGAEILLDGAFVGRIAEGRGTVIRNVRVGKREIRVRDFSGREAAEQIEVREGETRDVPLTILDLKPTEAREGLIGIGKNPQGYEEYWRFADGATVVWIPAGEFWMGSAEDQGKEDERPRRSVYVSEFLIDKTEVTWRQFRKFVEATGAEMAPAPLWGHRDDYAATSITWGEAVAYCEWVGGRLPTEAEWEKAARGTDGRDYPWGNEWDPDRCNSRDGGPHRPESVGSFRDCLSPYGVLDMAGGVWEWCSDWYAESYDDGPSRDPIGPASGSRRVLRGGAWMIAAQGLRTAYRYNSYPSWRKVDYGFRCVHDQPE